MSSWAHKGDKVRFLARNGYDSELDRAKLILKPGAVLTVKEVSVGNSSSNYAFEEIKGSWNTVMFETVPKIKAKPLEWRDVGVEIQAKTEFGTYHATQTGWYIGDALETFVKTSFSRYECQQDYDRRVNEAHMKDQAAKSGLGENDVWVTLAEIMGDKTPFLPLWAMMELNKRLNDKYFGGSLPDTAQREIERLKERLSIDPQGGDWIDVLEGRIVDLEDRMKKALKDSASADSNLQELIEVAYDGNGEDFVIANYPSTCAELVAKRHESAIKPGTYAVNFKNGISSTCIIGIDAEGRNWIASPLFSKTMSYIEEDISSIHPLDHRIAPE